ncbi:MAG: MarR family winged helix-turn-helix transcriptional regulator [Bryobacteraceae bacterium]
MPSRIEQELKQTLPFPRPEDEAFVALQRTADVLLQQLGAVLKPYGLSPAQYNVLRILRGAGAAGLACGEIGNRMITRDPDITRLLDRLERRGLVARSRGDKDRRVITVQITPEGLAILTELAGPLEQLHRQGLGRMGRENLRKLIELLDQARESAG